MRYVAELNNLRLLTRRVGNGSCVEDGVAVRAHDTVVILGLEPLGAGLGGARDDMLLLDRVSDHLEHPGGLGLVLVLACVGHARPTSQVPEGVQRETDFDLVIGAVQFRVSPIDGVNGFTSQE